MSPECIYSRHIHTLTTPLVDYHLFHQIDAASNDLLLLYGVRLYEYELYSAIYDLFV